MAKPTGKLTDSAIRAAKPPPEGKVKLYDDSYLYLRVQKRTKSWCWRYRLRGSDNTVTLGKYPAVTLQEARQKGTELAVLVARGVDPADQKRALKREQARTAPFEDVTREWLTTVYRSEVVPGHYDRQVRRLERHVFPWLGAQPLESITAPELLAVLRRIPDAETATRVRVLVDQIYRHAIATERATRNVAADLKGTLPRAKVKHYPALTDPAEVGGLLRAIEGYRGTFPVLCALRLLPYVALRSSELRKATWEEVDFEASLWTIPAERMKSRRDHMIPLTTQATGILRDLHPLTGPDGYLFPANRGRGRPMSDNTINAALRSMGYGGRMVGHGWRAVARTLMEEQLGEPIDLIEHQMAHAVRDATGRAYNRTTHLDARRAMMQRWADFLDALRAGGNVVPLRGAHGN
jgi:integrase